MIYSIIWNIIVCVWAIGDEIVICSNKLIWLMIGIVELHVV